MADKKFKFTFTGDSKDLEGAIGGVEGKTRGLGGFLSNNAGKIAGGFAAMFAVGKVKDFVGEMFNAGSAIQTYKIKAATVFEGALPEIQAFTEANAHAWGITTQEALGAAAATGDLVKPLGIVGQELTGLTTRTLENSAAFSMWTGGTLSQAEVTEVLNKAMLGERDGLQALGIKISQAEVDERALALAKAEGTDVVTARHQALATEELITLKGADALRAYADGEFEAQVQANELGVQFEQLKANLAEKLYPVFVKVIDYIHSDILPAFKAFGEWVWPKIQGAMESLASWWTDNGPKIKAFVIDVKDGVLEFAEGVKSAWDDHISPAVTSIKDAFADLKAKMSELSQAISGDTKGISVDWEKVGRVVGIVFGVIGRVIALGITAIGNYLTKMAEVARGVRTAITKIKGAYTDMKSATSSLVAKAKSALSPMTTLFNGIERAVNSLRDSFNRLKSLLSGRLSIPTPSWPQPPSWMRGLLPGFHSGGFVPGPAGADVPILAQAGERIVSRAELRAGMYGGSGGSGTTVVVNAYGATGREMVAEIERAVRDGVRSPWLAQAGVAS